jgi:tRNA pseudouridine55 synthase
MRTPRRAVEGVLILDKPCGYTSNAALQRIKRLFRALKAGHTGSLDPIASGVLPIFFGQVTRLSRFLLDADKSYECVMTLGSNTITGDTEGERLYCRDTSGLRAVDVEKAMLDLQGSIIQYPPMFSAVKVNGRRLYCSARSGQHVNRPARRVHVYEASLQNFTSGEAAEVRISISCSKGTYIRSWVSDLGRILGCGAYVSQLRRTKAGPYEIGHAADMETIEHMADHGKYSELDALLLSAQSPVEHLPEIHVKPDDAYRLRCGQSTHVPSVSEGMARILMDTGEFVGVAQCDQTGALSPHIMFNVGS